MAGRPTGIRCSATEGSAIADLLQSRTDVPVLELDVPPVSDAMMPTIATRLQALVESVLRRRRA